METKHTAGPWACDERTVYSTQGHQPHVCSCESIADGKLIASAPEMLHRLETALHALQCFKRTGTIELVDVYIDDITRTIAKATHP